ncbi:hypothetical protein LV779_39075 [Streptomyces thinghirensis]|nr:hypothetical protein [Streptomyces thinghirensis]
MAIAGGATNSWAGRYATPPAGTPTFYGMYYDESCVPRPAVQPVVRLPGVVHGAGRRVLPAER